MKELIFLLLLFSSSCTSTKKVNSVNIPYNISDTILLKYSYPIVGLRGDSLYQNGTGFFLKTNDGYRFITARHIVSEINTFNKEILLQYDYIGIIYQDTITKKSATIRLDIRQVKPLLPNTYFYETPDMTVFNFSKLNVNIKINSIESFIPTQADTNKQLEKIIAFGYAKETTVKNADNLKPHKYEGEFAATSNIDPYYPKDSINWVITPESQSGISGSPVFLKYSKIESGKKVIFFEFGGLLFGSNSLYHSAYMIRQDVAISELFKITPFTYTFQ